MCFCTSLNLYTGHWQKLTEPQPIGGKVTLNHPIAQQVWAGIQRYTIISPLFTYLYIITKAEFWGTQAAWTCRIYCQALTLKEIRQGLVWSKNKK